MHPGPMLHHAELEKELIDYFELHRWQGHSVDHSALAYEAMRVCTI
jgi:hypothetical protein